MGVSHSRREQDLLQKLYLHYKNTHGGKGVYGGGSLKIEGYSSLMNHANSVISKSKDEFIRDIAKAISNDLGIKINTDTPIDQLIIAFKRILPRPGSGKGSLRPDAEKHTKLCKKIGDAINKIFNSDVINVSATSDVICKQVAEYMYTLFTGLHTEFLNVSGDISRIIKNLEILQGLVDSANNRLIEEIASARGNVVSADMENAKEIYNKLTGEIRRQHGILSNLLSSTIGPIGSSLIELLQDNKDFTGLVEDIKQTTGTKHFGDRLSMLLSGVSDVATAANQVNKALKTIGLSIDEYKNGKGIVGIRDKIYRMIVDQKPSPDKLYQLLAATDILYQHDFDHDAIADYVMNKSQNLKKTGGLSYKKNQYGGADIEDADSFASMVADSTWKSDPGVFEGRVQANRNTFGKRLEQRRRYRNMLFSQFNNQIKSQYHTLIMTLNKIANKIGNEIRPSVDIEQFIRLLNNFKLSQPERKNIHIALSGIRGDAASSFIKNQYMQYIEQLAFSSQQLANKTGNNLFKQLCEEFNRLIKSIDSFNSAFIKSPTGIEGGSYNTKNKIGGADDIDDIYDKLDEDEFISYDNKSSENFENDGYASDNSIDDNINEAAPIYVDSKDNGISINPESIPSENKINNVLNNSSAKYLGGIISEMHNDEFKHYETLSKAIRNFEYYYKIYNIKHNMNRQVDDYTQYTNNYENILGEESGMIIDKINTKYKAYISLIEENKINIGTYTDRKSVFFEGYDSNGKALTVPPAAAAADGTAVPAMDDKLKDCVASVYIDGYRFLLEYIRSAKVEMIEAAQGLDLYMSKFTQLIQKNPDTISSFVKIIEQLELVAKWFTDKSGDYIAQVFECFDNSNIVVNEFKENIILQPPQNVDLIKNRHTNSDMLAGASTVIKDYTDHYYKHLKSGGGRNPGHFYKPRLMTKEQAIEFVKLLEKSIKGVRTFENIVNLFSKINIMTKNNESPVSSFMNPAMMFKAFMKYCIASSIGVGYIVTLVDTNVYLNTNMNSLTASFTANDTYLGGTADFNIDRTQQFGGAFIQMAVSLRFNQEGYLVGQLDTAANQSRLLILCDPLMTKDEITRSYSYTDKLFEMSLKSMVAKIFTTIGTYNLFHRPSNISTSRDRLTNTLSFPNNPIRQIIGGGTTGGTENIEIIPEAVELYIRLPLVVEWYRQVFEFEDKKLSEADKKNPLNQSDALLISLIPDIDNIWSEICNIIFIEAATIKDGVYSTYFSGKIINTINTIYTSYAPKKLSCKEIISEFIYDINKRYGLMKREEITNYLNERKFNMTDIAEDEYDADNNIDYDILGAKNQFGSKLAPSDKFRRVYHKSTAPTTSQYIDFQITIRRFRISIENNLLLEKVVDSSKSLSQSDMHIYDYASINDIISNVKNKILNTPKNEERMRIIFEHLQGVSKFGNIDQSKILILHETVITPLTILYFIYSILNDYNKFMISMDLSKLDTMISCLYDRAERKNFVDKPNFEDLQHFLSNNTMDAGDESRLFNTAPGTTDFSVINSFYPEYEPLFNARTAAAALAAPLNIDGGSAINNVAVAAIHRSQHIVGNISVVMAFFMRSIANKKFKNPKYKLESNKLLCGISPYMLDTTEIADYFYATNYEFINNTCTSLFSNGSFINTLTDRYGNVRMNKAGGFAVLPCELNALNTTIHNGADATPSLISYNDLTKSEHFAGLKKMGESYLYAEDYSNGLCGTNSLYGLLRPGDVVGAAHTNAFDACALYTRDNCFDRGAAGPGGPALTPESKMVIRRFILNRQMLMEDILRRLMNISGDLEGMVDIYMSSETKNRAPSVIFSKLEEICTSLLQIAKQSIGTIRNYFSHSLISKFDSNLDANNHKNLISLSFIQEHLFERLFKNRYGNGLSDSNLCLRNIWNELTRKHEFNAIVATGPDQWRAVCFDDTNRNTLTSTRPIGPIRNIVYRLHDDKTYRTGNYPKNVTPNKKIAEEYCYDSYNDVLSKLIFWDVTQYKNAVLNDVGFHILNGNANLVNNFPHKYIPIFKSGGNIINPKNIKTERDIIIPALMSGETLNNKDENILAFNERAVNLISRTGFQLDKYSLKFNVITGTSNLYDFKREYNRYTTLAGCNEPEYPRYKERNNAAALAIASLGIDGNRSYTRESTTFGGRDNIAIGHKECKYYNNYNIFDNTYDTPFTEKTGLLVSLNRLIYNYINMFIDKSSGKIYKDLIEKFVNGYNSKDILQGKNINDRVMCDVHFKGLNNYHPKLQMLPLPLMIEIPEYSYIGLTGSKDVSKNNVYFSRTSGFYKQIARDVEFNAANSIKVTAATANKELPELFKSHIAKASDSNREEFNNVLSYVAGAYGTTTKNVGVATIGANGRFHNATQSRIRAAEVNVFMTRFNNLLKLGFTIHSAFYGMAITIRDAVDGALAADTSLDSIIFENRDYPNSAQDDTMNIFVVRNTNGFPGGAHSLLIDDFRNVNYGRLRSAVCMLEPPEKAVIFSSLANGIRGLYTSSASMTFSGSNALYVNDNFTTVAEYQKELMRAYLPIFEKEFNMIIKRCEFLKQIIEDTGCKVYKPIQHYAPKLYYDSTIEHRSTVSGLSAMFVNGVIMDKNFMDKYKNIQYNSTAAAGDHLKSMSDRIHGDGAAPYGRTASNAFPPYNSDDYGVANEYKQDTEHIYLGKQYEQKIAPVTSAGYNIHIYNQTLAELDSAYTQPMRVPVTEINDSRKAYLQGILQDIISTSKSITACIKQTSKILADIPIYFETYKDSILDYNNRNNILPFMPLSLVTNAMNFRLHTFNTTNLINTFEPKFINPDKNNYKHPLFIYDNIGIGTPEFKFAYGTRGILGTNQTPSLEFIPGLSYLLEPSKYNSNSEDNNSSNVINLSKNIISDLIKNSIYGYRFIINYMVHSMWLNGHSYDHVFRLLSDSSIGYNPEDTIKHNDFKIYKNPNTQVVDMNRFRGHVRVYITGNVIGNADTKVEHYTSAAGTFSYDHPASYDSNRYIETPSIKNMACPTAMHTSNASEHKYWTNINNIIGLIENDNYKFSIQQLIKCINTGNVNKLFTANRAAIRVYNILDLNIVPINVHAMQREIPFINLINYAHTFDNIVKESIGIEYTNKPLNEIHGLRPKSLTGILDNKEQIWNEQMQEYTYTITDTHSTFYTEDALVRYMIYPLGHRRLYDYVKFVYPIMAGDTGLTLNRPKFLSDQLWNKVLLNSLYNADRYKIQAQKMLPQQSRREVSINSIADTSLQELFTNKSLTYEKLKEVMINAFNEFRNQTQANIFIGYMNQPDYKTTFDNALLTNKIYDVNVIMVNLLIKMAAQATAAHAALFQVDTKDGYVLSWLMEHEFNNSGNIPDTLLDTVAYTNSEFKNGMTRSITIRNVMDTFRRNVYGELFHYDLIKTLPTYAAETKIVQKVINAAATALSQLSNGNLDISMLLGMAAVGDIGAGANLARHVRTQDIHAGGVANVELKGGIGAGHLDTPLKRLIAMTTLVQGLAAINANHVGGTDWAAAPDAAFSNTNAGGAVLRLTNATVAGAAGVLDKVNTSLLLHNTDIKGILNDSVLYSAAAADDARVEAFNHKVVLGIANVDDLISLPVSQDGSEYAYDNLKNIDITYAFEETKNSLRLFAHGADGAAYLAGIIDGDVARADEKCCMGVGYYLALLSFAFGEVLLRNIDLTAGIGANNELKNLIMRAEASPYFMDMTTAGGHPDDVIRQRMYVFAASLYPICWKILKGLALGIETLRGIGTNVQCDLADLTAFTGNVVAFAAFNNHLDVEYDMLTRIKDKCLNSDNRYNPLVLLELINMTISNDAKAQDFNIFSRYSDNKLLADLVVDEYKILDSRERAMGAYTGNAFRDREYFLNFKPSFGVFSIYNNSASLYDIMNCTAPIFPYMGVTTAEITKLLQAPLAGLPRTSKYIGAISYVGKAPSNTATNKENTDIIAGINTNAMYYCATDIDTSDLNPLYEVALLGIGNCLLDLVNNVNFNKLIDPNKKYSIFTVQQNDTHMPFLYINNQNALSSDKYDILNNLFSEAHRTNHSNQLTSNELTYLNKDNILESTQLADHKYGLEGFLRYNTRLVRWIEWTVHVQRLIRIMLRNQLEIVQDPVISSIDVLSEDATEYRSDNKGYSLADFE